MQNDEHEIMIEGNDDPLVIRIHGQKTTLIGMSDALICYEKLSTKRLSNVMPTTQREMVYTCSISLLKVA